MEQDDRKTQVLGKIKEEVVRLVGQYSKESDRAAVILMAARIDYLLNQCLQGYLLPNPSGPDELLDSDRAVGTFSARTNLAYRLGLIDASLSRAIHLVRKIRNEFAHESEVSELSQPPHRDRVKELLKPLNEGGGENPIISATEELKSSSKERDHFLAAGLTIVGLLELLRQTVQETNKIYTLTYS